MKGDEFVEQIQDVQQQVARLPQNAEDLPLPKQSGLTESLHRFTGALRDLQAEETIRLLLSAVQQSRDSIIITTALLNPPGPEIVYVNPAFSEMTGYSTEEVLGRTPRILQGKHTDRQKLDELRRHLETGEPYHGEAINYHKDGTEFYVEWNITPIRNAEEKITHYVAIQRNISDRKRFEQEREKLLQQEQEARTQAEAANRTKDEFLATLSHELKTPLTPILGWSKVLRTKQLPESKLHEVLETIEEYARRQAQIVDDLLDLSRIVQGKLTLNLTAVDLAEPIAAALETVCPSAEAKGIDLKTQIKPYTGQVMGDASRLQQVFWNLLSNAIKFTPHGGRIEVRMSRGVDESMSGRVDEQSGNGAGKQQISQAINRAKDSNSPTHSPTHPSTHPSTHPPIHPSTLLRPNHHYRQRTGHLCRIPALRVRSFSAGG
ncbi:sensor histidine kinase [Leptolyngbya ohadii]|uniref:sensor histidine kinase n=1 Tax=Leptolyngbya ohadii TaxID=1962290 RepID=UPI000B5A10CE|nr:HAMP domain-containing sensor histidine kinase [Leptolyngbya ohadii]